MKKEELVALGIAEDVAAKVLEINGKDIEHAKSVKDKEIKTLQDERDGYGRTHAGERGIKFPSGAGRRN